MVITGTGNKQVQNVVYI